MRVVLLVAQNITSLHSKGEFDLPSNLNTFFRKCKPFFKYYQTDTLYLERKKKLTFKIES